MHAGGKPSMGRYLLFAVAFVGLGILIRGFFPAVEVRTEIETRTIPVTDIKTVVVPAPAESRIPKACEEIMAAVVKMMEGTDSLSQSGGNVTEFIDDAGQLIYTKDPNAPVQLTEQWEIIQDQQDVGWRLVGTAVADVRRLIDQCPAG